MSVELSKLKAFKTMPTLKSRDADWLAWMDSLSSRYGEQSASTMFLKLWEKRGSKAANTYALRQELKKKYKLEIDENFFNRVADLGGGIANAASGVFRAGKVTVIVIGGIVLLAGISIIINVIKTGQLPNQNLRKFKY